MLVGRELQKKSNNKKQQPKKRYNAKHLNHNKLEIGAFSGETQWHSHINKIVVLGETTQLLIFFKTYCMVSYV